MYVNILVQVHTVTIDKLSQTNIHTYIHTYIHTHMSIYVTFVSSLVHGPGAVFELHGVRLVKVTAENRQIGRESRNFEPYLNV